MDSNIIASRGTGESWHITWIIHGSENYGVRRAVLSLASGVRARRCRVSFVALIEGPFTAECRSLGFEVLLAQAGTPPQISSKRKVAGFMRLMLYGNRAKKRVIGCLRQLKPDVVHVLWPNLLGIAGAGARAVKAKCIWEMPQVVGTGYPFNLNARFLRWQVSRYDILVLANSTHTAKSLGLPQLNTRVMYLGIDEQRFDPTAVSAISRKELGISDHAILLAIFGRVENQKGQDRLVRAALEVTSTQRPIHILIVGGPIEGEFSDQIRAVVGANGIGANERVHWTGPVIDPERYYPVADVVVNNCIIAEGYGLSVVESLMMGRPVMAHALGGPRETIRDGVTGWHYPNSDEKSVRDAIERVLNDQYRWHEMGQAARNDALNRFSLNIQTDFYLEQIQTMFKSRRR